MAPFFVKNWSMLANCVAKFDQAGNLATGGCLVNDSLGCCLVDVRDGFLQSGSSGLFFACCNSLTNLLDQSSHGRANMGIARLTDYVLTVPLECGFMIGQGLFSSKLYC